MRGNRALPAPRYAVALTRTGLSTALRLAGKMRIEAVYAPARIASDAPGATPFDGPVAGLIRSLWDGAGAFLLFMAAGVAVRSAAPLLRGKDRDPAVVVFDPEGRFAVPLLSGHLGGANELALAAAEALGGTAVLTTATDAAGRPAAEVWARDHGFRIENPKAVVRVNAAWANDDPVGLYLDPELPESLSGGLAPHLALFTRSLPEAAAFAGALIAVSHREGAFPEGALLLRPPVLALGAGCRKDADPQAVEGGVFAALRAAGLSPLSTFVLATVDAKKDEPALARLAGSLGVPLRTYPAERLREAEVPNPSARVFEAVGTPSVCEAAALAASGGGRLVLPKISGEIWTLAAALAEPEETA